MDASELVEIGIPGVMRSGTVTEVGRVNQTKPAVTKTAAATILKIGRIACGGGVTRIWAGSEAPEYSVLPPNSFCNRSDAADEI